MPKPASLLRAPAPRQRLGRPGTACALAALLALAAGPAGAAEEEKKDAPVWQNILALQLSASHNCDLEKVLFFHEVPLGETVSTEGRARCIDGREFDFSRDKRHEKFTLRLCQPTVC